VTHDVETAAGQRAVPHLAALDLELGFRSCFNFVTERYPVDLGLIRELRAMGHEVGVHGVKHDGLKFSSREIFLSRLGSLREYAEEWKVSGFRSPATHRRWEWMPELPFVYDSSYPDTDPYEPVPGGCGCPYPFQIGGVMELPITLAQDHTLWEILQCNALPVWQEKIQWLFAVGGLMTVLVHPDYITSEIRWREYRALLQAIAELPGVWRALPFEVAHWWKNRSSETETILLESTRDEWRLEYGERACLTQV